MPAIDLPQTSSAPADVAVSVVGRGDAGGGGTSIPPKAETIRSTVSHADFEKIRNQFGSHAATVFLVWFALLQQAWFSGRVLSFTLADATLARRLGLSRFTILKAKRALCSAGLIKVVNKKRGDDGNEWKNEPTVWKLYPSFTPHGETPLEKKKGVSSKLTGGVSSKLTGGCLHPVSIPGDTKKECSGALTGPQNSSFKESLPETEIAGGLVGAPAIGSGGKEKKNTSAATRPDLRLSSLISQIGGRK